MGHQKEANLAEALEDTGDLSWSVGLDYGLLCFNRAAQDRFELNPGVQAAVGMRPLDILPPEQAALWRSMYGRAIEEGAFRVEYELTMGRFLEIFFAPIVVNGETTGVSVVGKDITERKQTEQGLLERESRLRRIFEQNGSIMLLVDPQSGEIVDANPAAVAFYGYAQEKLVGMNIDQINTLPGEEVALVRQHALLEQRNCFSFRHRLASGEERDVEVYASPVIFEDRAVLFSIVHDVTDRRQTEARLRDSEEQFRSTFEQAAIGIVHCSFDGSYLRCNRRFSEIVGYSPEEILGLSYQQITPPEDLAENELALRQLGEGRAYSVSFEKRFRRKDGSLTWVRTTTSTQRDGQGLPLHLVSFIEDIQEQKEAKERLATAAEALAASEARYRIAFQTSLDCILISTLKEGRYIEVNQAFLDTFGFERDAVIGHTSIEIHAWADLREREDMVEVLRKQGFCRNLEVHYRRKSGEIFWGLLSTSIIEVEGVPCHLGVIRDISVEKAAELRLRLATQALSKSEERYHTAFETCIDAFTLSSLENGQYFDVNQAFLRMFGMEREEVVGKSSLDLNIWVTPQDREKMVETLHRNVACRDLEFLLRRKNGESFWALISATRTELNGVPSLLAVIKDITEAKLNEQSIETAAEAVRTSEERYRTAFQTSLDGISITALKDGLYIDVNRSFLRTFGYERQEVIGKTSLELDVWADPYDRQKMVDMLRKESRCQDMEVRFQRKSGDAFWVLVSAALIELEGISCVLFVIRDISEAKAAAQEIEKLAFYDPLTHLPNRRLLLDRIGQALTASVRHGRKSALLFVDLDNFKTVNDILGHQIGDLLLHEVARRMVACVRKADTVARLGGDEFVVMLEELDSTSEGAASHARGVAEKILAALQQPYLLGGNECRSDCSIGITIFGDGDGNAEEVLRQADIAMYQVKTDGRGNLRFFAPALQAAVTARAALEEDLRLAIADNQFLLYYQPQVDRGRLIGAEGLIRWNHPTRGILAPGEFIPLAEETGQILSLGLWVLETACARIAAWARQDQTANLAVAVNISARQFRQADFVEQVLATIARSGANPRNLKLELTESILVESIEDVIAKMERLKANGVRIALDDFGTGYSSLSYLKRLPLEQLKIDRSFINDILFDVASGSIVETVISLGRAMGLVVMAEGVETEEQRNYLAQLGCYTFQGYLVSKPLPLEQFHAMWPELFPTASN